MYVIRFFQTSRPSPTRANRHKINGLYVFGMLAGILFLSWLGTPRIVPQPSAAGEIGTGSTRLHLTNNFLNPICKAMSRCCISGALGVHSA